MAAAAATLLSTRSASAPLSSHVAILRSLANKYHPTLNPSGFVNLAVAENSLMHDVLLAYINDQVKFNPHVLTYGCGGIGTEELRGALAAFVQRMFRTAVPLTAEHVVCTSGLTNAIESITYAVADAGDGILLARPFYGSFPHVMLERPGVRAIYVTFGARDAFGEEDAVEAYEEALTAAAAEGVRAKAILLCNPHNPLGRCYSPAALKALLRFAAKYGLHVISDEIYALSAYPKSSFTSILSIDTEGLIDSRLVHCLWGASKDFGASGIRLGAVISHNERLLSSIASRGLFNFPSAVADCIVAKMLSDTEFVDGYLVENTVRLEKAHRLVIDFLEKENIPYKPSGGAGFFLWINLREAIELRGYKFDNTDPMPLSLGVTPKQQSSVNVQCVERLYGQKLYLASGDAFGSEQPGWFRIIFSHPEEIIVEGLQRLKQAIEGGRVEGGSPAMIASLCMCFCAC